MSEEEESKRVSVQVSSLSTQLIESIDKQSHLEEQLLVARKVINGNQASLQAMDSLKEQVFNLKKDLKAEKAHKFEMRSLLKTMGEEKELAQAEAHRLNKEVEDLTASLFDEANSMVADARRETHNIQIKNDKLTEQLQEKDVLLETLKIQLKNLKGVLYTLEEEQNAALMSNRNSIAANETGTVSSGSLEKTMSALTGTLPTSDTVIFSPYIKSLRYDLGLYNEFLKFVAVLPECSSIRDTTSRSKLLRRLVHDEIQPMLRLDNASGVGWYVRRNLMNLMMEGMVIIEPISGINETYRLGHSSNSATSSPQLPKADKFRDAHLYNYPANSPPVAIQDPCAFCSESRNDILEHGRLYVLKTLLKNEDGTITPSAQFPLCHYCLLKIRQTCEIFAFLRLLKSGAWHLEDLSDYKNSKKVSSEALAQNGAPESPNIDIKSKRSSFMSGLSKTVPARGANAPEKVPTFSSHNATPSTNIQRAWAQLCKLRASLLWAHIGVWALEDCLETKLGPTTDSSENLVPNLPRDALQKRETRESTINKPETFSTEKDFDFKSSEEFGLRQSAASSHESVNTENELRAHDKNPTSTQSISKDIKGSASDSHTYADVESPRSLNDKIEPEVSSKILIATRSLDPAAKEDVKTQQPAIVFQNSSSPDKNENTQSSAVDHQQEANDKSLDVSQTPMLATDETAGMAKPEISASDSKLGSTTEDEDAMFDDAHSTVS
ncbi:LAME_0G02190g1_1 [Lachancea meyersii CBS 8951]|uniref:LAME_0G02190g1_1 n=1 Tax=Lachancea meyersii CBS 8951 TaxID=1266667 RepID=A0A1G4K5U0_9SACH|nr:LAME_0G02190g1_1 [Lachancea meyersii CBS 8951]